jgi:hypothetical protein
MRRRTSTKLSSPTTRRRAYRKAQTPQQLEKLKHELDAAQIYFWSEVEAFARVFYKPVARQSAQDRQDFRVYRRNKREMIPLICPP